MTIAEHIRKHILDGLGVRDAGRLPDEYSFENLRESEWCPEFERRMRSCLIMGAFRYKRLKDPKKPQYDYVKDMLRRLMIYEATGNRQMLVDVANECLIEYHNDDHPKSNLNEGDVGHAEIK